MKRTFHDPPCARRAVRALFCALALVFAVPASARADARGEAKRHFREGMALIAAGRLERGILELQQAYAIKPHRDLLYNIARAYLDLGRIPEALEYFRTHHRRPRGREMIRSIFTRDKPGTSDPAVAEALADAELQHGDTIPTGFGSLDKLLGGGFRRRDLILLGGDIGSGKSALALGIALRVAQQSVGVAYLSGEMNEERLMERALAIEGKVAVDELRSAKLNDQTRAGVGAAAVRLRGLPLSLLPVAGDDFETVFERLDPLRQVGLVVVDRLDGRALLAGDEAKIKEETKATIRCLLLDDGFEPIKDPNPCFITGKKGASVKAVFARSY